MSPGVLLLGAVLAGGEGRRFGAPKGDAEVGGISLVRRAVSAVEPVAARTVVVSSRAVLDAPVEVLADATPGAGPLGGLLAALDLAAGEGFEGVLLLACDLPLVESRLLRRVADALGGHAAVAPVRGGGGIEPLCAAYRTDVADAARACAESKDRSLHALFREVGGVALPLTALDAHPDDFLNVNTPEDRVRAEALLGARPEGRG